MWHIAKHTAHQIRPSDLSRENLIKCIFNEIKVVNYEKGWKKKRTLYTKVASVECGYYLEGYYFKVKGKNWRKKEFRGRPGRMRFRPLKRRCDCHGNNLLTAVTVKELNGYYLSSQFESHVCPVDPCWRVLLLNCHYYYWLLWPLQILFSPLAWQCPSRTLDWLLNSEAIGKGWCSLHREDKMRLKLDGYIYEYLQMWSMYSWNP
jgi:hypothetical protein